MASNMLRDSLPYGMSAGEGSASSSGSSLSSSMNRSRTSTGDSSLSTDTNGSSGSGTGTIPPTPPSGQALSSSSTMTNTTRRRSHRPRGCRGGRKNRKKNSQSSSNTDSSCSTNQQPVPTEIVGNIPLSPRDNNTQNGNSTFINGAHPAKAILNLHQPHARHLEVVPVQKLSDGADVNNRNMQQQLVSDENTQQATMTTNTTTMVAEGTHNSVVSSLLPHPQPILAANINNMITDQQDHQQQMYTRQLYHPNPLVRFQHHPSNTFIAHPMSYDRAISENSTYYHNDCDFHQNADNNNTNIRHQEQQQPQSTMDRHFDPSRSVDVIATKSVKQLQMMAANSNKMNMGEILPPLPSTKREDSPVPTGPNPYALTNADQSSENTSPIIMTTASTTTAMNAQSSNALSQFNVQTMHLQHIANVHSENISNNNNNNHCLSSSMTQDCYRTERLEKQRQMLADGGSLFVISPRSFLTGVKVVQPTTATATTTTAW